MRACEREREGEREKERVRQRYRYKEDPSTSDPLPISLSSSSGGGMCEELKLAFLAPVVFIGVEVRGISPYKHEINTSQ